MATSSTPLLQQQLTDNVSETDSSISSEEHKHWFRRLTSRKNVLPFFGTLVATLGMVLAITFLVTLNPPVRKNVVLMVSDGMGPGSLSLARSFLQYKEGVEYYKQLALDPYIVGTSRTRSHNSLITDSAAGATAFTCGIKTYNGAIAVDPLKRPCGTILEAAKRHGYMTGMVVTSKITDATPACFASHVVNRFLENTIAEQLVGESPLNRTVDLMFGGGRCHFLPKSDTDSCRVDDKNLVAKAAEAGYSYISDRDAFDSLRQGKEINLPLLGLFSPGHMSYTVDRVADSQPSLAEMALTALEALHTATKNSKHGFLLLIEGSRIDMASHSNDPVGHVHDVLAFNDAFHVARKFIERVGGVLISTSDHETGGLSVGRQVTPSYPEYVWYPEVLANASHSTEYLGYQIASHKGSDMQHFIKETIVKNGLGIHDASQMEIDTLMALKFNALLADYTLADMISRRAQIGWSTHGHSAVDVNIYAVGEPAREKLRGNHENTEIGKFVKEYLELDLDVVTRILNFEEPSWIEGAVGEESLRITGEKGRRYH